MDDLREIIARLEAEKGELLAVLTECHNFLSPWGPKSGRQLIERIGALIGEPK